MVGFILAEIPECFSSREPVGANSSFATSYGSLDLFLIWSWLFVFGRLCFCGLVLSHFLQPLSKATATAEIDLCFRRCILLHCGFRLQKPGRLLRMAWSIWNFSRQWPGKPKRKDGLFFSSTAKYTWTTTYSEILLGSQKWQSFVWTPCMGGSAGWGSDWKSSTLDTTCQFKTCFPNTTDAAAMVGCRAQCVVQSWDVAKDLTSFLEKTALWLGWVGNCVCVQHGIYTNSVHGI